MLNLQIKKAAQHESPSSKQLISPISHHFRKLLVAPSQYPWSDEEMIARYGMRYATPAERRIFPRKRLVISVVKAKIVAIGKSPYMDSGIGIGSVVWAVEWYPGIHQFRMLNRDLLQEEYNQIVWERVPEDIPVTTEASARRDRVQRQWRRKVCSSIQQILRL